MDNFLDIIVQLSEIGLIIFMLILSLLEKFSYLSDLIDYTISLLSILGIIFIIIYSIAFACGYGITFYEEYIDIIFLHIKSLHYFLIWMVAKLIYTFFFLLYFIAIFSEYFIPLQYISSEFVIDLVYLIIIILLLFLTLLILVCFYDRLAYENIMKIEIIEKFLDCIENISYIKFFINIKNNEWVKGIFIGVAGTFIGGLLLDKYKNN